MLADIQTSQDITHKIHRRPALSFAAACTFIVIAAAGLFLTSQSGPNRPGGGHGPDIEARQPLPGQQNDAAFTEAPQISLTGPDYISSEQNKDALPPKKASVIKKKTQPAEKLVVVANSSHFVQNQRTYKPQLIATHKKNQDVPHKAQKTVDTPEPVITRQAPEIETNAAKSEPDPILIVPEDQVIEVVQDDRNFDTQCSYEIQLVNTDGSGHAVPL